MTTEISSSAFAKLQSDVAHVKATLDMLVARVEPLLLARSGDLAAIDSIRRDLDASHARHREHDARLDAIERKVDKWAWMLVGAWAVVQVVWGVVGPKIIALLGG